MTLAPQVSWASRKKVFLTRQIASLTLNFSTIWLVGRWLMLSTLRWNRNRVYSSVTPTLAMLRWRKRHIVNQALHKRARLWHSTLHALHSFVSRFVGVSKAPLVQYMPYCTAKKVNLRLWTIYSPPGNILHKREIYCPGEWYIAWGSNILPWCKILAKFSRTWPNLPTVQ